MMSFSFLHSPTCNVTRFFRICLRTPVYRLLVKFLKRRMTVYPPLELSTERRGRETENGKEGWRRRESKERKKGKKRNFFFR